ncbi:MAG: hypothetical protein K8R64_02300 [Methanosarcinaceae archaeon]|nr:hypothetical protein [Methanosarcinaceae archaeon]
MAQEQGIAKVDLSYIIKAVMMGNSLYSDDWEKGVLYLTNMNLWFSLNGGWSTIPLGAVTMIGRQVDNSIRKKAQLSVGTTHVLIIDYMQPSSVDQQKKVSSIALLAGKESLINTLKTYLQPMCGIKPKTSSFSDIDKKLLYMLYTGVTDMSKLGFLMGVDTEALNNSFKNLIDLEYCDRIGSLTTQGLQKIKEII